MTVHALHAGLSPRRAHLASFEHAYAVALQQRRATGRHQFIVQTGNPLQPFRTSPIMAREQETLLAIIV